MDPNNQQQNTNFSLNRDNNQQSQPPQQQFVPFGAFPANIQRDYDQNIYRLIFDLVERKYCPNAYLQRMMQSGVQLSEKEVNDLKNAGPDINPLARDFEISRAYNKLEIEIFEVSTYNLSKEKQDELRVLTDQSKVPGADQSTLVQKIQSFMQQNVPNIGTMVDEYMRGFMNQYMAGRY